MAQDYSINIDREPVIMGILNVTPDSFSDGGKYSDVDAALNQANQMIEDGADILDIGGESTRPGYTMISVEAELDRILPVIEKLKENYDTPISVDTYKWTVAEAALNAGADMINDIWGLNYPEDPGHKMAKICAKYNVPICVMHNNPIKLESASEKEFLNTFIPQIQERIAIAKTAGIKDENIILDPGVGFAKNLEENKWSIPAIKRLRFAKYQVARREDRNPGNPVLAGCCSTRPGPKNGKSGPGGVPGWTANRKQSEKSPDFCVVLSFSHV